MSDLNGKFLVACPLCGWNKKLENRFYGKKGRCPKCDASFPLYPVQYLRNTDDEETVEAKVWIEGENIMVRTTSPN